MSGDDRATPDVLRLRLAAASRALVGRDEPHADEIIELCTAFGTTGGLLGALRRAEARIRALQREARERAAGSSPG